jgi:hypothetical protein
MQEHRRVMSLSAKAQHRSGTSVTDNFDRASILLLIHYNRGTAFGGIMRRLLLLTIVVVAAISLSAQFAQPDIPAYHPAPPAKTAKLPPVLSGFDLVGASFQNAFQSHAYVLAAKIPRVIYQQPCYCRCDRSVGHTSLHSCFESTHGAHCSTCLKELYFAYKMNRQGKTVGQIRQAIERGEFESIDLQTAASIN